ncbi:CDP-alcohol phosphatidyltransferase family protein [Sediminibacterium soli]|uniref:CDP-alcohol phosphatidyltransferase family protein n=1 Tax=Sediminibacterium soli TaxID=2698829 RepID=UPI00137AA0CD|nr:CDP-alcohol phosphatidyltransferase family protein [Sediminibacterium soli]NCI45695.1 CDP-alcohol phosphatidyltransferase [Sediminibacterium soli]
MKQIPNLFTLLNLFFGCIAIVCIMQPGLSFTLDANGENLVSLPERVTWASLFIALAALIDFLDGFMARLLKVPSELGKQLDSLADGVSFGVAPGLIVYQFLRLSFAKEAGGLDTSILWLLPAFILPCAGAYRLARFNIDPAQGYSFKGVPIPAAGLFIASLPLVYWYTSHAFIIDILLNKWFWYALIAVISYLMVSTLPMLALKFSQLTLKKATPFLILALVTLLGALSFGWLAVSISFIAYVILSLSLKQTES